MRKSILLLFAVIFTSCQPIHIKGSCYKTSDATLKCGNISQAKSLCNLKNDFESRTVADLENKIRATIEIIPYDKNLNKIYQEKIKYNQSQAKLTYIDS